MSGRPAAEVALELGMTVGAVYAAKCRGLGRLRQDLRGLLGESLEMAGMSERRR
jgi:hypothetical protein